MDQLTPRSEPKPWQGVSAQDAHRQAEIVGQMNQLAHVPKGWYTRLLGLLDPADQQAVAYRTLRAVLAGQEHTDVPLLVNNALNISRYRPYLLDQIALYVFLFKTERETQFLEEVRYKLRSWAEEQLQRQAKPNTAGLDVGAADIAEQACAEFERNVRRGREEETLANFYVDALLTTYLWGYVRQGRLVNKWIAEKYNHPSPNDLTPDEQLRTGSTTDFEDEDELQYRQQLLSKAIAELSPDCQKRIWEFMERADGKSAEFRKVIDRLVGLIKGILPKKSRNKLEQCMDELQRLMLSFVGSSFYLRPR